MKLPKEIPIDKEGQYCVKCFSGPIKRVYKDGLTFYKCTSCRQVSDRSVVVDNKIEWWIDESGIYWHESVGVIVLNRDNKICCVLRKIFPFSYALPAGHLDRGEKPIAAAARELHEETGIQVSSRDLELIGKFDMPGDSCRRGSDHHKWHLYRLRITYDSNIILSDEASTACWYGLDELQRMNNVSFGLKFIVDKFGDALF